MKCVSCEIKTGITGLVGLSGSGKSTLGRLIKGLIEPTKGEFRLQNGSGSLTTLSPKDRMKLFGWASPHPETQLFASTVWEDIAFGPTNQGLSGSTLSDRVCQAMELVGLPSDFEQRHPYSLSGGQRRRVALAGVLAMHNQYYIFDEPSAGLDERGRDYFIGIIQKLRDQGCGILWITHELTLLESVVDDVWLMEGGRLMPQQQIKKYIQQYAV